MTPSSEVVQQYSVATAPRGFWVHAWPVHRYAVQVAKSWDLVWNFFRRELRGRFSDTIGGSLWVLVQPVFQFCVYFLIFGILFADPRNLAAHGPDPLLAVYLFAGIVMFNSITESIGTSLGSILSNSNLVKKVRFPCELLPLSPILTCTTVYVVGSLVLVVVGVATGQVVPGWSLLLWPVLIMILITFCAGLGLFLAAANVFARDVQHLWRILSMAWFFLSPVFWQARMIQEKADVIGHPWLTNLLLLNPAYSMLLAHRQVLGVGAQLPLEEYRQWFPMSVWGHLGVAAAWAFVIFFVGHGFFMSRKHKFADLV